MSNAMMCFVLFWVFFFYKMLISALKLFFTTKKNVNSMSAYSLFAGLITELRSYSRQSLLNYDFLPSRMNFYSDFTFLLDETFFFFFLLLSDSNIIA